MSVRNSHSDLLNQCRAILEHLATKDNNRRISWNETIQNSLCNVWNKVNYYYYEVYLVLTNLYKEILARQTHAKEISNYQTLLNFLQTYMRISSPSEEEQDQWFQLFPNSNNLPSISNFRLPFTRFCTKEPLWGVLKPELSLRTYKVWYNIVPQLGLDQNMLCLLTIQRLTSDQLSGGIRDKSSWRLQACNSSVLQEIQECVKNIEDQEMASAALYYVVIHMPPGADQMAAAQLCYRQAEQWMAQDIKAGLGSDKANIGFAKVQKKYLTVCTSHLLHSCGLGKQEYIQLVLRPQELIIALYNDPTILQHRTGSLSHCPDINSVVLQIGELHKVNVLGIQQELVSEWLYPPDSLPLDMSSDDITQNINIAAIQNNPLSSTDNDNIIRACYVLESMDIETAAKYLLSFAGLRDEADGRPTAVRLRALQCLCSIATSEVVIHTTGTSIEIIKANMLNLTFISELEKLGLVWSMEGFKNCNKEDVVRILLIKGSPHAVQMAAVISCIYKLLNTQHWDQILQLMTSYGMVEELNIVLPELTYLHHLLNTSIFVHAWNYAVITPLQKAEFPMSEECKYRVHRSLEMLYCCPIPRQLNLTLMLSHCQRLSNNDLTARLQPFLTLSQSSQQLAEIKQEPDQ